MWWNVTILALLAAAAAALPFYDGDVPTPVRPQSTAVDAVQGDVAPARLFIATVGRTIGPFLTSDDIEPTPKSLPDSDLPFAADTEEPELEDEGRGRAKSPRTPRGFASTAHTSKSYPHGKRSNRKRSNNKINIIGMCISAVFTVVGIIVAVFFGVKTLRAQNSAAIAAAAAAAIATLRTQDTATDDPDTVMNVNDPLTGIQLSSVPVHEGDVQEPARTDGDSTAAVDDTPVAPTTSASAQPATS